MAFFQWDKELDVGVEAMNAQHQKLIGLMEEIYQLNSQGAPKAEIEQALDVMAAFAVRHFEDEEAYMQSVGFPTLEAHRQLHINLRTELTQQITDFKQKDVPTLTETFMVFLKFWLSTHIRGIDTKYGQLAPSA